MSSPQAVRSGVVKIIWRPGPALLLVAGVLFALGGCRPTASPPAATPPTPATAPTPAPPSWRWLNVAELQAATALVNAAAPGPLPAAAPERQAYLRVYARTFAELSTASLTLPVLRRLWELSSAARWARLSAGEIRRAVGLGQAAVPPSVEEGGAQQPLPGARLLSPSTMDPSVRTLLRATKREGGSYADFVSRWVRYVVIVEDPAFLNPDLPLTCEGAVEVLSGTVFLTDRDAITGQTRPPWKAAAALVHEAEHIRWFYAVAGSDPRMIYKAPDERNAYRGMFLFLREVRLSRSAAGAAEARAIAADMRKWHGTLQQANTLLGYPPDDLSSRHDLIVSDEALRTDPVAAGATPSDEMGAMPR